MIARYILRLAGELHIGQRLRQKHVFSVIHKMNLSGMRVLDAGCGTGVYAVKLARTSPTTCIDAVDIEIDKAAAK